MFYGILIHDFAKTFLRILLSQWVHAFLFALSKKQQGSKKKKKIKKVHTGYCERSKAALQLSGKHNSSNTNYICEVGVVVKYYLPFIFIQ